MKKLILFSLCLLFAATSVTEAYPTTVEPGWDLFVTQPGTVFMGHDWLGVPLNDYDFGGTIGTETVGDVDTIVERQSQAEVPGPGLTDTIDIEIVALQLVSVDPIDLGAGLDFHYVTLQDATASTGTMDITFDDEDGGTFGSFFDIFFDIRIGDLTGPIIFSDSLSMESYDNLWTRIAPPGAVVLDDVNHLLNGVDITGDFWPQGIIEHDATGAAHHVVENPEPATMLLLGLGGLMFRKRRA